MTSAGVDSKAETVQIKAGSFSIKMMTNPANKYDKSGHPDPKDNIFVNLTMDTKMVKEKMKLRESAKSEIVRDMMEVIFPPNTICGGHMDEALFSLRDINGHDKTVIMYDTVFDGDYREFTLQTWMNDGFVIAARLYYTRVKSKEYKYILKRMVM